MDVPKHGLRLAPHFGLLLFIEFHIVIIFYLDWP